MMKYLILLALSCSVFFACNNTNKQDVAKDAKAVADTGQALIGAWKLEYINGPAMDIDTLYPGSKPEIKFELTTKKASGTTSCNNFTGPFTCNASSLKFSEGMIMTKMACPGMGEPLFLEALSKVTAYKVAGGKLEMYMNDSVPLMRFATY